MIRKLLVGISAAALVAVLAPVSPAQAQTPNSIAVVFTAGAEVCSPTFNTTTGACDDTNGDGDPDGILAPTTPSCAPSLCEGRPSEYRFTTDNAGVEGQLLCVGVGNGVPGVNTTNTGEIGNCTLASDGVVESGILPDGTLGSGQDDGPWCGWSSGSGDTGGDRDVNGASNDLGAVNLDAFDVDVSWTQSAGTLLPLEYHNSNGDLVGVGAVQTLGADGPCGLSGDDGATNFSVTGYTTVVN